ncbi:MAG: glycogen/starch synthase [Ignisphaera sp.]
MYSPHHIRRIWILTFEFSGIAKVGGLGEVIPLVARELTKKGYDVVIVMPSHGITPHGFKELDLECQGSRYGIDGVEYPYDLGFLEGVVEGVKVVLVKGKSYRTSMVLDVWPPYSYVSEKACLLARAVHCLAKRFGYPDIIHANDWHSAVAAALLKIDAELRGYALPVLYQIHLRGSPSYPWHYASEHWCGLPDTMQRIWATTKHIFMHTKDLWDSCWGNIECFIVKLADTIATVSKSELELLVRDYGEWIRGKTCYSYNSTSWSIKEVEENALKLYNTKRRGEIRWRLVNELLQKFTTWGYLNLTDNEVLVISSGRLTPQKGFDVLLHAAKLLPPSIKVIVLGRRVGDESYEHYLRNLLNEVWGKTIIIVDDVEQTLYQLLIYSSHVYSLSSRYEPFGISGIEALALGTPIVVSNIGGLGEYVSDLRVNPLGVGIKVQQDNVTELAMAIQSLGYLVYYSETGKGIDKIVFRELRDLALREHKFGEKLRDITVAYVDMIFRPEHTANSTLACYELARQMAFYRANA